MPGKELNAPSSPPSGARNRAPGRGQRHSGAVSFPPIHHRRGKLSLAGHCGSRIQRVARPSGPARAVRRCPRFSLPRKPKRGGGRERSTARQWFVIARGVKIAPRCRMLRCWGHVAKREAPAHAKARKGTSSRIEADVKRAEDGGSSAPRRRRISPRSRRPNECPHSGRLGRLVPVTGPGHRADEGAVTA